MFEQDEVAALETSTDSYTLLNASLTWHPNWGNLDALVFLKADQPARRSGPLAHVAAEG